MRQVTVVPPTRPLARPRADVGVVPGSDVLPVVQTLVQRSVEHPEAPVAIATVVALFLLVQHRIDRRDPKLAIARRREPEVLRFGSTVRPA